MQDVIVKTWGDITQVKSEFSFPDAGQMERVQIDAQGDFPPLPHLHKTGKC